MTSYYANAENWNTGIPIPPNLEEKGKAEWQTFPVEKKIHVILEGVQKERAGMPADQATQTAAKREVIASKCWEEAKKCNVGNKIITIARECFQCSQEFKEKEIAQNHVTIKCHDGDVQIPSYLLEPLTNKSAFFRQLFSDSFKKTSEEDKTYKIDNEGVKQSDLKALIEIWSGEREIENSQEAYDILPAAQWLGLMTEPMEKAVKESLLETIKNWSETDPEDIKDACDFANEFNAQDYDLPEVKEALQKYLLSAYQTIILFHKNVLVYDGEITPQQSIWRLFDNSEERLVESLKRFNITSLQLDRNKINYKVIDEMVEAFPKITSLSFNVISDETKTGLHFYYFSLVKLQALKDLDLTNSTIDRKTLCEIVKQLPNLESLNITGCSNVEENSLEINLIEGLAQAPKLKNINISNTHIGYGYNWGSLTNRVEQFVMNGHRIHKETIRMLSQLTQLKVLSMQNCRGWGEIHHFDYEGPPPLLPQLRELDLSFNTGWTTMDGSDLKTVLKTTPNLEVLKLNEDKDITDEGLKALLLLPNLTTLEIKGREITPEVLEILRALPKLKTVNGEPIEKFLNG